MAYGELLHHLKAMKKTDKVYLDCKPVSAIHEISRKNFKRGVGASSLACFVTNLKDATEGAWRLSHDGLKIAFCGQFAQ